jgi:hypothetical protein
MIQLSNVTQELKIMANVMFRVLAITLQETSRSIPQISIESVHRLQDHVGLKARFPFFPFRLRLAIIHANSWMASASVPGQ